MSEVSNNFLYELIDEDIENGKVKECGSHMQLMELDGLYAEMFRSQAQWYTEEGSIGYEEK